MSRRRLKFFLMVIACSFIFQLVDYYRGFFVDKKAVVNILEERGYTEVLIIKHEWGTVANMGCSGFDAAKFTANVNLNGMRMQIFVCTGLVFKNPSIFFSQY